MPNILYIGDPFSVHEIKWMSFFSKKPNYNVFIAAQDVDVVNMNERDHARLAENDITLIPGLRFYSARRPWDNWHSAKVIRKAISEHKIDLVHGLFFTPYCVNTLYSDLPTVITSRGSDVLVVLPELGSKTGLQGLHDKQVFRVFKKVVAKANAITCTSTKQQESLKKMFGANTDSNLVRTGVDVESIATTDVSLSPVTKKEGKKLIFFPRYIASLYNTMLPIKAIKLLPKEVKETCQFAFIIGRYHEPKYFEQVKSELGKMDVDHVFLDHMTQKEIWAIYRQSDLTVMTPKSDGTPNSALEAMAAKSQLIIGPLNYDSDIFNSETCLQMTSWKPEELSGLMRNVLEAPNQQKVESGYDCVLKKGNRAVEMGKLEGIYDRLLA